MSPVLTVDFRYFQRVLILSRKAVKMLKVLVKTSAQCTEIGLRTNFAREGKGVVFYVTDHNHQRRRKIKKWEKFEVCG